MELCVGELLYSFLSYPCLSSINEVRGFLLELPVLENSSER